jgi:hypothetical protein
VTPVLNPVLVGIGPSDGYWAISPHQLSDGAIGFGLRQGRSDLFRGNGVYRVMPDGHGWMAIAGLPPVGSRDATSGELGELGAVHWSPKGVAFLMDAPAADAKYTGEVPDKTLRLVGLSSGQGLWDASSVLTGASTFAWGPED